MGRYAALLGLLLVAACGGSSPTNPPPPPPPPAPGAPASLTIQTGDAQTAVAGTALPLRLSVLVKDASARPVPGVAVQFSVDSGGGALAAGSVATGADGVATSGTWTLGGSAGPNVVVAAVAGLPPAKFRAQGLVPPRTLFSAMPVSPGGGSLRYSKPDDPLTGLTLTVPAGAYPSSTQWTIVADSGIAVPLPADFAQVGPVLVVSNGQDYADSVMTLTMPMHLAADVAVAPFYFDPATGTLEGIPMVGRTDSSATLATRHFSAAAMALPGNAPAGGALRMAALGGFGTVQIVWVATPKLKLVGTFTSSFHPGNDDWEFANLGDYISPLGDCEGMSISVMYYHYFVRAQGQPQLFHRYDTSVQNQWDNVQGIRFAGSVQEDVAAPYRANTSQLAALTKQGAARGENVKDLTSTWVLLTLKLNAHPVLLSIYGGAGAHAVVAYAATSTGAHTDVSFSDPNFPGVVRTMAFESGILTPVTLQTNAGSAAASFTDAYALGVSGEVPLARLSTRWAEFGQKKAGNDRYPKSYQFEVFNHLTSGWEPLGAQVLTTDPALMIRSMCQDCTNKTGVGDQQYAQIWDGNGTHEVATYLGNGSTQNAKGVTSYIAVALAKSSVDRTAGAGFLDATPFTVDYRPFTVSPSTSNVFKDSTLILTASAGALATPGSTYTWTLPGTAPTVKTGDSTFTHQFTTAGQFVVTVTLTDAQGKIVAVAEAEVKVEHIPHWAWKVQSAGAPSILLPPGGLQDKSDTLVQGMITGYLSYLRQTPGNSLIYVGTVPSQSCSYVLYEQFPVGQPVDLILPRTVDFSTAYLGTNCPDPDIIGSFSMGPLGSGSLVASMSPSNVNPDVLVIGGGSINATMHGTTLQGTFTWNVRYTNGFGKYTVAFQAVQVWPVP